MNVTVDGVSVATRFPRVECVGRERAAGVGPLSPPSGLTAVVQSEATGLLLSKPSLKPTMIDIRRETC